MKTTMKKFTAVLTMLLLFAGSVIVSAQDEEVSEACALSYSNFRSSFKAKNYDAAYEPWLATFENCPKMSINIYKNGIKMLKKKYKDAPDAATKELIEKVYLQRLEYFPTEKPGKMYSEYGMFMDAAGASEEKVFGLLQQSYDIKPSSLGIKAIFKYFDGIILRNKDTNVQAIFDMSDNLQEVVGVKIDAISKELDAINAKEAAGEELSKRDIYLKKANATNLKGLGMVEPVLNQKLDPYETCDRLLPLYEADYSANSGNAKWLQRSISRLYHKGCTDTGLYNNMVESYLKAAPSADGYVRLGGIKLKAGLDNEAVAYFEQAVALETDSYRKANILYSVAQVMARKGLKSKARNYAHKALKERPSLGKAYLLIAHLYATSASSCGAGNTFKQRMIYQAALNQARKASSVDPSIYSTAKRAIKNYQSKAPTNKDVFSEGLTSGDPFTLGCWIGGSVRIP